jgi:transglutaminase-like putative cysteine protease
MDCNARDLASCDTFDLYLADKLVGTLIHASEFDENSSITLVSTTMSASMGGNAENRLDVKEQRRFNVVGSMVSAYQEVSGPSGVNSWGVKKDVDQWDYTVIVGGVRTSRKAGDIVDNISSSCRQFREVTSATVKKGETWYDTAFEMVSGQNVVTKICCTGIDSARHIWTFENTDNLTNRAEKQWLDASARVIKESIAGIYTAKNRDKRFSLSLASLENRRQPAPGTSPDASELFSIPADRPKAFGERIALKIADSANTPDSTVAQWYVRKGNLWILAALPATCGSTEAKTTASSFSKWLLPTISMQCDNRKIKDAAIKLRGNENDACAIIEKFTRYVFATLQKRNTATFSNALETLEAGYGDCGEHAVLLGALLRAAGVPARVVLGLVYVESKKAYMYHAWVMAYGHAWVFADAALGAFPAIENYVPLIIDDSGSGSLRISRLIGKMNVEYISIGK